MNLHSKTFCSLAKDQTEINRIIAEVSKGSKFYEVGDFKQLIIILLTPYLTQNEKRKDQDLTERISKIIATRDEALKAANISRHTSLLSRGF